MTSSRLRRPLLALALGAAVAAVAAPAANAAERHSAQRPNVVVVMTDDQDFRSMWDLPKTRRLVVDRGTTFATNVVNFPLCCPSRATYYTGEYAHNHGVLWNTFPEGGYYRFKGKETLPVWLQRAGYRTAHVGKYLNRYTDVAPPGKPAPGWDVWHTVPNPRYYDYVISSNGGVRYHGLDPGDYITTVLNRYARRVIRKLGRGDRPFYLQLDHRAPHTGPGRRDSSRCMKAAIPAPRDAGLFRRAALPRPPSFNERDMSDKPSFLRRLDRLGSSQVKRMRKRWSCALASLREVDRGIRRMLSVLRDLGEASQTAILLTSDNGFFYGEHRVTVGKVLPYEEAERLPLIMRVPPPYRDFEPRIPRLHQVAANIDLAPTILALADAGPCSTCRVMDGRSLVDLINGNASSWPGDRGILLEYRVRRASSSPTCHYTAIHTGDREYIEHSRLVRGGTCVGAEERELYDLTSDPFQRENLCAGGCPGGRGQDELEERLQVLRGCQGIAGRDPQPPSGYCE